VRAFVMKKIFVHRWWLDDQAPKSKKCKQMRRRRRSAKESKSSNQRSNAVGTNLATNLNLVQGKKGVRKIRNSHAICNEQIDWSFGKRKKRRPLSPQKEEAKARTLLVFVDYTITLVIFFFFFFFFVMSKIVFFVEVSIFSKDVTAFVGAIVGCRKR
jgi:hypothetical protein